ncbi:MAG: HlyD family secretion protein [Verrucomicrobiales bacterium]|jgi:HlyD family secretion protein
MFARIFAILFALALLGGGGWGVFHFFIASSEEVETPVFTVTAETRDIQQVVRCIGQIEPALFTDLKAEVSGRIVKIHILEGDQVKKDRVLIELDRRELDTQIVEQNFKIEAARLRAAGVKLDYEAKLALREKNFVSEREFSQAEIDFKLAENEFSIQQSQLQLLKEKLEKTRIVAPHDGIVLEHKLTEGTVVTGVSSFNEGSILMRVAQLTQLEVETEISEVDVDKVQRGMDVTLTFDSLADVEVTGKITFISPSARPKGQTSSGGSGRSTPTAAAPGKARVFPITVSFPAENLRVRPGMTAQVKIVVEEVSGVVAVGLPGVFVEEGQSVVYVKDGDETFERREVEIGINDHQVVEIKAGLEAGDELATVKPKPAGADAADGDETTSG